MNTRKSTKNIFLLTFLLLSSSELAYNETNSVQWVNLASSIFGELAKKHLAILARDPLTQYTNAILVSLTLTFCPKIRQIAKFKPSPKFPAIRQGIVLFQHSQEGVPITLSCEMLDCTHYFLNQQLNSTLASYSIVIHQYALIRGKYPSVRSVSVYSTLNAMDTVRAIFFSLALSITGYFFSLPSPSRSLLYYQEPAFTKCVQ